MDEYSIIETIVRSVGGRGRSKIGDDVAVIAGGKGNLVAKCDMLVGRTDVPKTMTLRQAARKAVAMTVSDFASKGVEPRSFMVSLGLPRRTKERDVEELAKGFADARREWNLELVGGDTNEASDLVIDTVLLGFADRTVPRDGARPGQYVVVSGHFGYPPSGLRIIGGAKAEPGFGERALGSVLRPTPRLKLGLKVAGYLSSSMDSSDGLAICLHTLCSMSGVGMKIDRLPKPHGLDGFAAANGYESDELLLYGGEEYEIVGTVEKDDYTSADRAARAAGHRLLVIGETTKDRGQILLGRKEIEKRGWIQFSERTRRGA